MIEKEKTKEEEKEEYGGSSEDGKQINSGNEGKRRGKKRRGRGERGDQVMGSGEERWSSWEFLGESCSLGLLRGPLGMT